MVHKVKINVGYEVARFLYRQATDTRVKGLYCGGYITRFLKGYNIFQAPVDDPGLPSTKITDGPFHLWGLVKIFYPNPRPGAASSSRTTPANELQQLRQEFQDERRKNKRFRASVWAFLGRLASCFSPPPTDLPTYESSPEPLHTEEPSPEPPRREGKAPAIPTDDASDDMEEDAIPTYDSSDDEEEAEDTEEQDDDDEEEESGADVAGTTASATESGSDDND